MPNKPKLHRQVNEYFNNRKEGPKPNHTSEEGDDAWSASRKSLSRPVRSFLGYHCGRPDYRASCKLAFQLWGDTLRSTLAEVTAQLMESGSALDLDFAVVNQKGESPSVEQVRRKLADLG